MEELSFGEVIRLYNDMSIENKKVISNTFACLSPELESWLNTLNFIRNRCAHNKNIIDIKIKTKPKLRGEWKDYLIINDNNQTSGHIADTIAPMVFLTTQINNSYKFFYIQRSINNLVSKDDDRAIKLGFKNYSSSREMIELIRKQNKS